MRVLIVGAGAVGQTYAYTLKKGGAQVGVVVRDKYAEQARAGYDLFDHGAKASVRLDGCEVYTSAAQVADVQWDAVLLCTSGPALQQGTWLSEIGRATGDATIVGLQPGLDVPAFVAAQVGAERVVWGIIQIMAYEAPMEGRVSPPPGVAFWTPPLVALPLSGPSERVRPLVAAFRAGGMRAREVADAALDTAMAAPLLNLYMAALEVADWRIDALVADRALASLAGDAVRESVAVAARERGVSVPWWTWFVGPGLLRVAGGLAPRFIPIELEAFLRTHFTKIGEQTRGSLAEATQLAAAHALPHQAMDRLGARLAQA